MELIINADDYGISREVNCAIKYCFEKGFIQQTSLMVNMPFAVQGINLARENGYADRIGLHINLIEGEPLTEGIKHTRLCDESGRFNGSIMKSRNRLFLKRKERGAVKEELSAQIDAYMNFGCFLCNVDSHQHVHTNLSVLFLIFSLLREKGDFSVRLSRNIPTETVKGIKGVYKRIINRLIIRFNKAHGKCFVGYFGSASDYDGKQNKNDEAAIEIMVHPIMLNDCLRDAFNDFDIEQWLIDRRENLI
ncbi:MAG: ChbG/HpnK family deacetylase [Ruminococcus flavefaciens]|nr:ChbG/HpnK family deacetylase [Ruminococcus flavefaciens]